MILVTGGTGFLGSYIIKNLIEKDIPVRAIRRASPYPFYISDEIFKKVEWVHCDLLDISKLKEAAMGVDGIIHAAAIVSFSHHDRHIMNQVNVEGTSNLVNVAIELGTKRFLHISSVAAIGRTETAQKISEQQKWQDGYKHTYYGLSKREAEMHVYRGFAEGLEGAIINPSTILGFGNWHQSSCAIFKNAYREFKWYTHGMNGFVGVEDVAEAAVQLIRSKITDKRYIINAENWEFQRLFNTIADHFHKKRPKHEASKSISEIVWRLEKVKEIVTGKKALLTSETARMAYSKTSFDNSLFLKDFPEFIYTPLEKVIENSCKMYEKAIIERKLTL